MWEGKEGEGKVGSRFGGRLEGGLHQRLHGEKWICKKKQKGLRGPFRPGESFVTESEQD